MSDFQPSQQDFVVADKAKYREISKSETKSKNAAGRVMSDFLRNKSTIFGGAIIIFLIVFMLLSLFVSKFEVSDMDKTYANMKPKADIFSNTGFWDGTYSKKVNEKMYYHLLAISAESLGGEFDVENYGQSPYNCLKKIEREYMEDGTVYRDVKVDSYLEVGFKYLYITDEVLAQIRQYETLSGLQVLFPLVDEDHAYGSDDPNCFYFVNAQYPCNADGEFVDRISGSRVVSPQKANLKIIPNYLTDENGQNVYALKMQGSNKVRVLYYNYFSFVQYTKTGNLITTPSHVLGSDPMGYDIFARLGSAIGISLSLALLVFVANFLVGTVYGAVEGYYGGAVDLVMKRISEIISEVPFFILASLLQIYMVASGKLHPFLGLLYAFCLTGWIGIANTTRRQIYRFKNREYVLASAMLGASDRHILLRHIYPNSIGTIITSTVLTIPGVIFSETSLSFLGIVDLNGARYTSLGTMLANGQECMSTSPHVLVFPALVISLLMIGFNLIGNGLREATSPNYRGGAR